MSKLVKQRITELKSVLDATYSHCSNDIFAAIDILTQTFKNNNGVFVFGNGGSAADAQHIVGELNGRFLFDRPGLKAQSLVGDAATMTCISNDFGYHNVFSRQIESNAKKNDLAWAMSTSGNSQNVVNALKVAKKRGLNTMSITGLNGGECKNFSDVSINIQSEFTPHIQEVGVLIYHCICEQLEINLFNT